MPSAALLLPQPSFTPTELPAALEEVLHVQLYKITLELGSSQTYVVCMYAFDIRPLFLCGRPFNKSRRSERGSVRHTSGRFIPHW